MGFNFTEFVQNNRGKEAAAAPATILAFVRETAAKILHKGATSKSMSHDYHAAVDKYEHGDHHYQWDLSSMEVQELFSSSTFIFLAKVLVAASIVAFGPALVLEYVPTKKVEVGDPAKAGSSAGRTQRLLLTFAGGGLMAEAALHLLPHLFMPHGSHDHHGNDHGGGHHGPLVDTYALIALGFLATFAIDRFVGRGTTTLSGDSVGTESKSMTRAAITDGAHDDNERASSNGGDAHHVTADVGQMMELQPAAAAMAAAGVVLRAVTPFAEHEGSASKTEETSVSASSSAGGVSPPGPVASKECAPLEERTAPAEDADTVDGASSGDAEVPAVPIRSPVNEDDLADLELDLSTPARGDNEGGASCGDAEVPVAPITSPVNEDDLAEPELDASTPAGGDDEGVADKEAPEAPEECESDGEERTEVALTAGMRELQEVVPNEDQEDEHFVEKDSATMAELSNSYATTNGASEPDGADASAAVGAAGDSGDGHVDALDDAGDGEEVPDAIHIPAARPLSDQPNLTDDEESTEAADALTTNGSAGIVNGEMTDVVEGENSAHDEPAVEVTASDDADAGDTDASPEEPPRATKEPSPDILPPPVEQDKGGAAATDTPTSGRCVSAQGAEQESADVGVNSNTSYTLPTASSGSGSQSAATVDDTTVTSIPQAAEISADAAPPSPAVATDKDAAPPSAADNTNAELSLDKTVQSTEVDSQPELTRYGNRRTPVAEENAAFKGKGSGAECLIVGEPPSATTETVGGVAKEPHLDSHSDGHSGDHDDHGKAEGGAYATLAVDVLHNIIDGVGIGAAFALGGDTAGCITALLKLIHEIQHEVGDVATLVQYGMSKHHAIHIQHTTAAGVFLGVAISLGAGAFPTGFLSVLLALSAGATFHLASGTILGPVLAIPAGIGGPSQAFLEILALAGGALGVVAVGFAEKVAGIGH